MSLLKVFVRQFFLRCVLLQVILGVAVLSLPVAAAYRPPNLEKEIFVVDDIQLNRFDRAGLVGALVSVARDFDLKDDKVEYDVRSYALAIASRLNKDSAKVKDTLEQLKDSGNTIGEAEADKKRTAGRLYSGIRSLMRKKDNEANLKCAAYCVDIALQFAPDSDNADKLEEMAKSLEKDGHKANWKGMLKAPLHKETNPVASRKNVFEKVERTMPGGEAKEFARRQARIMGLTVRRLPNGKHVGAAHAVIVTTLEEEDQEDLLFKFDQNVGTMMAGSLEDVIKFMRVRHSKNKVPSGYLVDITLGDKHGLVDGPSAGTAFALVIDSLFTGDEIDPAYACTGTITADGESGVIGGVAGKIRGAINKDCTIVGIPKGNSKAVWDTFLLDGIGSLLKINIFTQKNFEDAYKLSRVNKAENITAAMEDYKKVADLVQAKGKDQLNHPAVKKKLQEVLDKTPNHLSAKVLLDFANGKHVKTLSLRGSFDEIDMEMVAFRRGLGEDSKTAAKESIEHLEEIEDILDSRVQPYFKEAMVLIKAIEKGNTDGEDDQAFSKRIISLYMKASKARAKIMEDPKIVEEMSS